MARRLVAAAERRFPGRGARLRRLLPLAGVVLAAGYLLGYTEIRGLFPFTSFWIAVFSGATELWLITSACMYGLYLLARLATRRMPPFDPSRRRLVNTAGGALLASPFLIAGYGALVELTKFR